MLSLRPKPRKKIKPFILCFILPVLAGLIGNIYIKNVTGDKSPEHYVLNQMGVELPSDKYENYEEQITLMNEKIRKEYVSRGDVQRIVEKAKIEYQQEKVIKAINNHLDGLLSGKGEVYYDAFKQHNVSPLLLAAISIHETRAQDNKGIWRPGYSQVLRECNNVAGINWDGKSKVLHKGRYRIFNSIDESIYNLAYILRNYYLNKGRDSIDTIGPIFCPENDPDNGKHGMDNSSWIPSVTRLFKLLEKEASSIT